MKKEVQNFLNNNIVKSIKLIDESTINISFENSDKILKLFALGDCCSESWFEISDDFSTHNSDSKIIEITKNREIDMPPSNVQEYDINEMYQIIFDDGTIIEFIFRNSSNGYYHGWISMTII